MSTQTTGRAAGSISRSSTQRTPRALAAPAPHRARACTSDEIAAALRLALPRVDARLWAPALANAFDTFNVGSARRVAAALGQFSEEAGQDFREIQEKLSYSTPERVCSVFRSHFASPEEAVPFLHAPEALGNRVYAHYCGNGSEASGDGFRFRGRGLIQLTGRDMYAEFGHSLGMTAEQAATFCETPAGAATSGCWYLASRGCLERADLWDIASITRVVNGKAMLGLDRRIAVSNAALAALDKL